MLSMGGVLLLKFHSRINTFVCFKGPPVCIFENCLFIKSETVEVQDLGIVQILFNLKKGI